ncbi:MAG: UDP-N-acetylmuramoyl-L-alanyl-D-glutamate--2 6-diaminopimelate ligase [Puniceicoccaceae bacterium 5H]|nr:MAG: UDP-N-acetylmuramoyl-L-alanyl-D-glutamate--2 6-diaminopimelate ligase [Puniceicoccaceae bacterium 5H]
MASTQQARLLSQLLQGSEERQDKAITGVTCRLDRVQPGMIFAAVEEFLAYQRWQHGLAHLTEAVRRGASSVVTPRASEDLALSQLVVGEPRRAYGTLCRAFWGAPDLVMKLIGVTGTNGKSTTSQLIAHLYQHTLGRAGSMGTLGTYLNGHRLEPGVYTTPLAEDAYRLLAHLRNLHADAVAMEVSSHGLALDRVTSMRFGAAVFLNLGRDHLDFHGSPEAYHAAKLKLFQNLPAKMPAIVNADDPAWQSFASAAKGPVLRFGMKNRRAEVRAIFVKLDARETRFTLVYNGKRYPAQMRLLGRFMVSNALAAITTLLALGAKPEPLLKALKTFNPLPGRMEAFPLLNGATALVDYAHNPDGLERLLENVRAFEPRQVLLVFGAGGDRDKGKRPLMGEIAARYSDRIWISNDNPRSEDPAAIAREIEQGTRGHDAVTTQLDRARAIREAYAASEQGDVLVLAGKGHEDYMQIGNRKLPYSDVEVVRSLGQKS